jgi:hypothetical protein
MSDDQGNVLRSIRDLGYDFQASIADIDEYVDALIAKVHAQKGYSKKTKLNVIFELEDARQKALLNKYCTTVQPL